MVKSMEKLHIKAAKFLREGGFDIRFAASDASRAPNPDAPNSLDSFGQLEMIGFVGMASARSYLTNLNFDFSRSTADGGGES